MAEQGFQKTMLENEAYSWSLLGSSAPHWDVDCLGPTQPTYRAATENLKLASSSQLPEEGEGGKKENFKCWRQEVKGRSQTDGQQAQESHRLGYLSHLPLSSSKAWPRECQALLLYCISCLLPGMGRTAGVLTPCSPPMAGNSKSWSLWKREQGW